MGQGAISQVPALGPGQHLRDSWVLSPSTVHHPPPSTGRFLSLSLAMSVSLLPSLSSSYSRPPLSPNPPVCPYCPPPPSPGGPVSRDGPTSKSSPLSQLWHTSVCTLPPTRKVANTRRMRGAAKRKLRPTPLWKVRGRTEGQQGLAALTIPSVPPAPQGQPAQPVGPRTEPSEERSLEDLASWRGGRTQNS